MNSLLKKSIKTQDGRKYSNALELETLPRRERRHPGRWVVATLIGFGAAALAYVLAKNDHIDYGVVGSYLFSHRILMGLIYTVLLTLALMALALLLGVALASMRMSANPVLATISWVYIWLMRGVPVLLQMIFWFNLALLFKNIELGIPGTGMVFATLDTNNVMTPFMAALLGLGLAEAAYVAEIVRGGLLGVDIGQREAADAMGLTKWQSFRKIIMPQVWRIIVPPIGNEFIGMFKTTSLASVIGVMELLGAAQTISSMNYKILELLIVASVWYVVCTTILSIGQAVLEARLGRGFASNSRVRTRQNKSAVSIK